MPIYLDTHIVVWLAAGELSRLSGPARQLIQESGVGPAHIADSDSGVATAL